MKSKLGIAVLFYGLLAAAAVVWRMYHDASGLHLFFHPERLDRNLDTWLAILGGGGVGIAFGFGVARLSQFMVRRYQWSRMMHIEFRGLLGPLDDIEILAFALFSAVGEELFFRGAMQVSTGIVISSLVFGVLHIGPDKKFLPWPVLAIVMGFAFGALFWLTGNLVAPILAHFVINYQNLHFINRYDPSHHHMVSSR